MMVTMKPVFSFHPGESPLLVSIPHSGIQVPRDIYGRLTPQARQLQDTDWYVDRLYDWCKDLGAGMLVANYSRFVIDLNRPPDNAAMYPGHGTGLLPSQCFDGSPIYKIDMQADEQDENHRLEKYWQPYHDQLDHALEDIKRRFGFAVLLDAHSIRSVVPMLFEGRLPDLNLGTYRGTSADPDLISKCYSVISASTKYSSVLDGRFQGGYITRNYGRPDKGVHALQLEMAQSVYMSEQPPVYEPELADQVSIILRDLVRTLINWSPA